MSKQPDDFDRWTKMMNEKEEREIKQKEGSTSETVEEEEDRKTAMHPNIDSNLNIKNVTFVNMPKISIPPHIVPMVLRSDMKWYPLGSPIAYIPRPEIKEKKPYRRKPIVRFQCKYCGARFVKDEHINRHLQLVHNK